jgi:monovalent cation/proton antiporter MnhG/PhaG subunit
MNAWDWIAGALLVAGVGVQLVCCLGLLLARDVYDRLHVVAPAGMLGGPLVCAAVLVNESFSQGGIKAVIVGAILVVTGPVLTHATGRAARLRQTGHVPVLPSEVREAHER